MGRNQVWGIQAVVDLYDCNPELLKSPDKIKEFVIALCEEIDMKRHGETHLDRFGDGVLVSEGWSFMQFIETSSITGHFEEVENKAFLDIFSCKDFDTQKASKFCAKFFGAKKYVFRTILRK